MDIKKYIYSHCAFPKKVRVWDSYLNQYVFREVPCGKCLHCRLTRMNEWVTRLYAEQINSKFVYYITLDYAPFNMSNPVASLLAAETLATYNNLNINHSYGLHPVILCRNHYDDFLKRLRKNKNGVNIRHFGCGEYGSKWSRPHFHLIIFSDGELTINDFIKAWTIDGYNIGRVDFHDLRANGTTNINKKDNKYSSKYVFSYVCKYIMKGKFNFNKLKTIDIIKKQFNLTQFYYENKDSLFPKKVCITDQKILDKNWSDYCKKISPFISCSRRPAIGLSYLQTHVERFETADFRLFGLPKECKIFPRYFLRKTKEFSTSIRAISDVNQNIASASRCNYIISMLREILSSRTDIQNFSDPFAHVWCQNTKNKQLLDYISCSQRISSIYCSQLSFYDCYNDIMFAFNGYDYNLWQKSSKFFFSLGTLSVEECLKYLESETLHYINIFVNKLYQDRCLHDQELNEYIKLNYDNIDDFHKYVKEIYDNEIKRNKDIDILINNSHIVF